MISMISKWTMKKLKKKKNENNHVCKNYILWKYFDHVENLEKEC